MQLTYMRDHQPRENVCRWPDSGKWAVLSKRLYFRMQETGYFDGED